MFSENATDRKCDELDKLTTELSRYVHAAADEGRAIHAVEQGIWKRVLELGRQALGRFIADQGDGEALNASMAVPLARLMGDAADHLLAQGTEINGLRLK